MFGRKKEQPQGSVILSPPQDMYNQSNELPNIPPINEPVQQQYRQPIQQQRVSNIQAQILKGEMTESGTFMYIVDKLRILLITYYYIQ
jgi:hypothetical protein